MGSAVRSGDLRKKRGAAERDQITPSSGSSAHILPKGEVSLKDFPSPLGREPGEGRIPIVVLKPHEDRRVRRGHLWIFSNEVESFPPDIEPGRAVHFHTAREGFLGVGFYNPHSLISGRVLDRRAENLDKAFFEGRLRRALELRQRLYKDEAYRWVFGESDDLPGLVVDRYGDALVLESYCAGMDRLIPLIVEAAKAVHPWEAVILRNDVAARRLERLPETVEVLEGTVESPHWFVSDGIKIAADLQKGQKTGFFLDQRENRRTVAALSGGKRVLDLFCHTGGFGLWCAQAGAENVTAVDNSDLALDLARRNAQANGFDGRFHFEKADVFQYLSSTKENFDVVVVDPPRFANTKKQLPGALEAYIRLNAAALKRVAVGGFLAAASCSQHVDREAFRQIIARASYESGRRTRIIHWGGQAPDHPVRPSMPETEYLKFALVHVS